MLHVSVLRLLRLKGAQLLRVHCHGLPQCVMGHKYRYPVHPIPARTKLRLTQCAL